MFGDAWDPVKIAEGTSTDLNQEGVGAEAKIDSDKRACAAVLKDFLGKMDQALEKIDRHIDESTIYNICS